MPRIAHCAVPPGARARASTCARVFCAGYSGAKVARTALHLILQNPFVYHIPFQSRTKSQVYYATQAALHAKTTDAGTAPLQLL